MDKLNEAALEGLLNEVLVGQHGTQTTEPAGEPQDPAGIHALLHDFPPQPLRPPASSIRPNPAPSPIAAVPLAAVAAQPTTPGGTAQHFLMSGISKDNPSVWAGLFPPPQHSRRYRKFMKDERKQWERAKTPGTPPPASVQGTTAPLVDLQPTDIIESHANLELLQDAMLCSQSTGSAAPSPKNRSHATNSSQSSLSMTRLSGTLGSGTLTSPLVPGLGVSNGSLHAASVTTLTVETPTAAVVRPQHADPWGSSIVGSGTNLQQVVPQFSTSQTALRQAQTTGFGPAHSGFGVSHLLTPPPTSVIAPRMAVGNLSLTGTPGGYSISPKANNSVSTMGNSSTTTGSSAQTPTHFALDFLKAPPQPQPQPPVAIDQPFALAPGSYQPGSRQLTAPTGQKLPPPAYPLETAVLPSPPAAQIGTVPTASGQHHYTVAGGTSSPTGAHNAVFPAPQHRPSAPMQHGAPPPLPTYSPQRYVPVQQPQVSSAPAPTYYIPGFAGPAQPTAAQPPAQPPQAPQPGQGQQVVFVFLQPQPQLQPTSAQHSAYQPQPQPQLQQQPQQHVVYRAY